MNGDVSGWRYREDQPTDFEVQQMVVSVRIYLESNETDETPEEEQSET